MAERVNVAVVRAANRRDAVATALTLIARDLETCVHDHVIIKPNLVSHKHQLPSTHADTFSAALDAVFAAGAKRVTVAEGASDATAGFARFGYHRVAIGRPVSFFDINRDETDWTTIQTTGVGGSINTARVSATLANSECRVSLAIAKTHVTSILTLSLKNMLSSLHPSDRVLMHGQRAGADGLPGWKRAIVELLKRDNAIALAATRSLGLARGVRQWLWDRGEADSSRSLAPKELAFLRTVQAMNHNLVELARRVKPHIAVVDGFVAMHREGPRHGSPIKLGTVIAGTDAVAVDAVAAAIMGFDPRQIGYLVYAERAGLGTIDLDRINIVGDPIASVRRACVPHSNYSVQRHWNRLDAARPRSGPHTPARQREASEAA